MLQDISNLSSTDPKVCQVAAWNIIQHVSESQNKGDLEYLVKRLVNGLESVKISTRTGCYSTLATLLSLRRVDPVQLFDMMQKALITNKQNTKKERRLIYIARILCSGAIFKTVLAADLVKDKDFLSASLNDVIELALKKSTYFQLATPFLCHLLADGSLTQQAFDSVVWPCLMPLFSSAAKKKAKRDDEDDEEEEEEEEENEDESIVLCCKVEIALACKNGEYKSEFECLGDVGRIVGGLLSSKLAFPASFLTSLFKHLQLSDQAREFWTEIVEKIRPTQFDLLCLCIEKAVSVHVPPSAILSKKLVTLLLSVFKEKVQDRDTEFHGKSRAAIQQLVRWDDENMTMGKKQRKSALKELFGGEPPNLLHEYKYVASIVRQFLGKLKARDLEILRGIIETQLENPSTGVRMAIVYLQFLGKVAQAKSASSETSFEIGKRLLRIAIGKERVEIKKVKKEGGEEDEAGDGGDQSEDDIQAQVRKCCYECLKTVLAGVYKPEFVDLMAAYVIENGKELSEDEGVLKAVKDVRKVVKKLGNDHLKFIVRAYCVRVVLDEGQVVSSAAENLKALIEIVKESEAEDSQMFSELVKFILDTVLREQHPAFDYEGLFNRLMIEGKVDEESVQAFADAIDVQIVGDMEEEDDDDDSDEDGMEVDKPESGDDDDDEDDDDDDSEDDASAPPAKKRKELDPETVAKLKEEFGGGSDSEESIDVDEATEDDLKRMDGALAKVFAVKRSVKESETHEARAVMRTHRLVDTYVRRHIKCMPVSSLLVLMMPVVHSLQNSLRLRKNTELTTKVIGALDNLNRCKKFVGVDDVVEGTLASMATDLYAMAVEKKNKLIRELLEHSVVLITKCFLQKSVRSKKESKRFIALYVGAVETANKKVRRRKVVKRKQQASSSGLDTTSRFIRLAINTLPEWPEGKNAIHKAIERGDE